MNISADASVFYDMLKTTIATEIGSLSPLNYDFTPVDYVAEGICYWINNFSMPYTVANLTNPHCKSYMENGRVCESISTNYMDTFPKEFSGKESTYINCTWTASILKQGNIECPEIDAEILAKYLKLILNDVFFSNKNYTK